MSDDLPIINKGMGGTPNESQPGRLDIGTKRELAVLFKQFLEIVAKSSVRDGVLEVPTNLLPRAGFDIRVIELPTAKAVDIVDGSVLHGVSAADDHDYQYPFSALKTFFQSGISVPVDSVFGRTGAVVAAEGDYKLDQLGDVALSGPSDGQVLLYNGSGWVNGSALSSVDLGYTASATNGVVTNSAGDNATIPVVDGTNAGLMTPTQKTKLDGIESGANANVGTNLGNTPDDDSVTVTSSTGTDTVIAAATTTEAGVMTKAQATKLSGIESGAQVNVGTDLSHSRDTTTVTVRSSTGNNATLPAATTGSAGVMTKDDKVKLNGISPNAEVNVPTNLSYSPATDKGTVNSSTGTNAEIPVVDSNAGLMTPTQKTKLDGVESGAQVNVGTNLTNTPAETSVTVKSSTGGDTAIAGATATDAGVMTAAQVTKLNGIQSGAQVNVGTNLGQKDRTATNLTVTSSTGSDTILPAASTTQAGLLTAADKVRIGAVGQLLLFQGTVDLSSSTVVSPTEGGDRGFTWINDNGGDIGSVKTVSAEWAAITRNLNVGDKVTPGDFVIWSGEDKNDFVHMVNAVVPTDLGVGNKTGTTFDVTSSTGADATLPAVTTEKAGLMTANDKSKLDGITAGADPFVGTNLSNTPATTTVSVNSSTGDNTTLPAATTALAGVMTKDDKVKLNGVESGAQKNVGTNLTNTPATTNVTVESSTGNNTIIDSATESRAGVMTNAQVIKLNGIQAGAGVSYWSRSGTQVSPSNKGDSVKISDSGNTKGQLILGDGNSSAFNVGIARWDGASNTDGAGGLGYFAQSNSNKGGHYFYTGDAAAGSTKERVRINDQGLVGIGTMAPSELLDISSTGNAITRINSSATNTAGVILARGGNEVARVSSEAADTLSLSTGSSATPRLTINSKGDVGIGTSDPSQKLTVYKADATAAITGPAGRSSLLMGNQDSDGANTPSIIAAANGELIFATGTSWSGNGGTLNQKVHIYRSGAIKFIGNGTEAAPKIEFDETGTAGFYGKTITHSRNNTSNNGIFLDSGDLGAGNRPFIQLKGAGSTGLQSKAFEVFYNNGGNSSFGISYDGAVSATTLYTTGKITSNSGGIQSGNNPLGGANTGTSMQPDGAFIGSAGGTNAVFRGFQTGGNENITLSANGNGSYAGNLQSGGNAILGNYTGVVLRSIGIVQVARPNAKDDIFVGYQTSNDGTNKVPTTRINADGSVSFADSTNVGDTLNTTAANRHGVYSETSSNAGRVDVISTSASDKTQYALRVLNGTTSAIEFDHAGKAFFAGKVTSAATQSSDGATTLATKGYVDSKVSSVPSIEAGTIEGQRLRWNNTAKEWRATDLFY